MIPFTQKSSERESESVDIDSAVAWKLVNLLARRSTASRTDNTCLGILADGQPAFVERSDAWLVVHNRPPLYRLTRTASALATQILDLFLPVCVERNTIVAHIAQSLDGRIATTEGESKFISGPEDLIHTHRLRSVSDAVIVGARTVINDDPQLTTRRVEGPSPVRVVLDPRSTIPSHSRVLSSADAPTLLITAQEPKGSLPTHVESIRVPTKKGRLDLSVVVAQLRQRGLRRLFIEGGGVTLSRFLQAGLLDRLHVAIAPTILGSGRSSFELPPLAQLADKRGVSWTQYTLGRDVLLDCVVGDEGSPGAL